MDNFVPMSSGTPTRERSSPGKRSPVGSAECGDKTPSIHRGSGNWLVRSVYFTCSSKSFPNYTLIKLMLIVIPSKSDIARLCRLK